MSKLMMQAIRVHKFGGPKVLSLDKVPVPSPSETQVLIKVKAAGVNPVDTYIREGALNELPDFPFIPGKDGAGIIEKVGQNVTKFKEGQKVFFCKMLGLDQNGSYAQYTAVNEKEVFPLPERLNFAQGAAIGIPYCTAYRALMLRAKAQPKETVLVHGASGSVGLAALQLARNYGMVALGTAGTPEGLKLIHDQGAVHVFNHKERGYLEKIMEATENKGVNVILEMLANVNLGKDLSLLAKNGRILVIGSRGNVSINPREIMGTEGNIKGVLLRATTEEEWKITTDAILDGLNKGILNPIIDKEYPLDKVADAHHDIIHSKGAKGKLILLPEVQSTQN